MAEIRSQPPPPLGANLRTRWLVRPDVTFLNHGSFGAAPRLVLREQDRWRQRIEEDPVEVLGRRCDAMLNEAKGAIGGWLGMASSDFGLVTNATEGVNAVLRSLALKRRDEIITTTHVYNAVRRAMQLVSQRSGARYREIDVPTPLQSSRHILDAIVAGLSARTRLLVIDHVTSPTALVFPVQLIVRACRARGVDVLIDGAHAPGMLPLRIGRIGAAYYAGNLHKWACAPKGCAFLWVRPDRQKHVHPTIISHNLGEGLAREFAWQGTREFSAWFAAPAAIRFMADLGWENVRRHNHELAVWAQRMLCDGWNVPPISPLDGRLIGAMATILLPGRLAGMSEARARVLQQNLHDDDRIEVPLIRWQDRWHIRVSCQVYNRPEDYIRLANAIAKRI